MSSGGSRAVDKLLHALLEAHDSVLSIARTNGSYHEHDWVRDFAVGQVVLTNDLQRESIFGQLLITEPKERFRETDERRLAACE
jgi:hypothetical protein